MDQAIFFFVGVMKLPAPSVMGRGYSCGHETPGAILA